MPAGQTQRELSERKLRIAEYKWKVYPLITERWQHISKFLKIAKNKSQTYFCNEQEQQAWARETGGHTRGGHITHGYRKPVKA